jgi:hypothetical protein
MHFVLAASHGMQLLGILMSPAQQQAACKGQGRAWYFLPQAQQQEAISSSSMCQYPCKSSTSSTSSIGSSSQEMAGLLMLSQAASATNSNSSSSSGSSKQACPTRTPFNSSSYRSSVCLSRGITRLCGNRTTAMGSTEMQVQVC